MKKIIDPQGPDAAPPRKALDQQLSRLNTVLCLVFGEGADANEASRRALKFATTSSDCASVEVVRLRDPDKVLTRDESTAWRKASDTVVTVLMFDRKVAARLPSADAVVASKLLDALVAAAAGEVVP